MPVNAFQVFLQEQKLQDQKLLLLVSGGVDSMVLLHVAGQCVKADDLHVLHFNHQVRKGHEEDEKIVQKICSYLNISCTIKYLSIAKETGNLESKWREERGKLSTQLAKEIGAERILTAHHATDLVETMIFRLTKGCGPGGLAPFDISTKPFWSIPKIELVNYAQKNKIPWNQDPTNDDLRHQRNIIRHHVLPELRKITPNLEKVFVHESMIFGEIDEYLKNQIPQLPSYSVTQFLSLPKALQRQWLRFLTARCPSFDEMEDFFRWIERNPPGGSQKELGGTNFKIEKGHLIIKN